MVLLPASAGHPHSRRDPRACDQRKPASPPARPVISHTIGKRESSRPAPGSSNSRRGNAAERADRTLNRGAPVTGARESTAHLPRAAGRRKPMEPSATRSRVSRETLRRRASGPSVTGVRTGQARRGDQAVPSPRRHAEVVECALTSSRASRQACDAPRGVAAVSWVPASRTVRRARPVRGSTSRGRSA